MIMIKNLTLVKTIISICDFSGVWSKPYRDEGYAVFQIDLQLGQDVRLFKFPGHSIYGILAAPPCTVFCRPSSQFWDKWGDNGLRSGLAIVDACLRLVTICKPHFWALENPPGRLSEYLGPPTYSFQPWEFGNPWTKQTYLWGKFNIPVKTIVKPVIKNRTTSLSSTQKNKRSETPSGFAKAFFKANQ